MPRNKVRKVPKQPKLLPVYRTYCDHQWYNDIRQNHPEAKQKNDEIHNNIVTSWPSKLQKQLLDSYSIHHLGCYTKFLRQRTIKWRFCTLCVYACVHAKAPLLVVWNI